LISKVKAILRRKSGGSETVLEDIVAGGISIDRERYLIKQDGK